MAIPSRQIGWSTKSNLLWQISKQLEALTGVIGRNIPTTTTTTTIHYYYYSGDNCINPLFSRTIRSLVSLSTNDVVLTDDGACYTINSTYVGPDYVVEYVSTEACFTAPCPTTTTTSTSTSTTTTTTTLPPYRYYNVEGFSCNPCNSIGPFTAFVPYNTPLTIGYYYNNPENRGYSFRIIEEIAPIGGGYNLTGEPGYVICNDACNIPTTTTTTTLP